MKAPASVDVGMALANYSVTIRVTGAERFRIRMWIATWIARLAFWIGGVGLTAVLYDPEE